MAKFKSASNESRAKADLQAALKDAVRLNLVTLQLEIRQAICELDFDGCDGKALEEEVQRLGFVQVAERIAAMRKDKARVK